MVNKKDTKPDITFTWQEGRYFDLWMVVHVLMGTTAAFALLLLVSDRLWAYLLALIFIFVVELCEVLFNIHEAIENRVMDVVVGFTGFIIAFEVGKAQLTESAIISLLVYSILILVILNMLGWLDKERRNRE